LEVLSRDDARRLLASWSGGGLDSLPGEADEVVEECGYLPLAISVCGAMVRDGVLWRDLVTSLKKARLGFLEGGELDYAYASVLGSLTVGFEFLEEKDRDAANRYLELAVFPSDEAIPEAAVVTLWGRGGELPEEDSRKLLATLDRKSLLRMEGGPADRRITLHDLQYDFLRSKQADWPGLHNRPLDAYRAKCGDGWHTGPNDAYFFQRLAYHLSEAGRKEQLRDLLLNYA
jgi:hypothetical protein